MSLYFSHPSWQERCNQWEAHVNVYAVLNGEGDGEWKASRIRFLFEHLSILDTKFNVLLTVDTLLLVAFNVLLNFLLNKQLVIASVGWIAICFGLCWLITMIICLIGERRLVWGDLGLVGEQHLRWDELKETDKLKNAEAGHVTALIVAVAKRTNKFRVALLLTYFNVGFLAAEFIDVLLTVPH